MSSNNYYIDDYFLHGFEREELSTFFESKGISLDLYSSKKSNISDSQLIEYCEEDLLAEIERLKETIVELKAKIPLLLTEYRDDDPLLLAIQIRSTDWVKYNPDNDRQTRGNQEGIIAELKEKGFTKRQAESIELVACPIRR